MKMNNLAEVFINGIKVGTCDRILDIQPRGIVTAPLKKRNQAEMARQFMANQKVKPIWKMHVMESRGDDVVISLYIDWGDMLGKPVELTISRSMYDCGAEFIGEGWLDFMILAYNRDNVQSTDDSLSQPVQPQGNRIFI
jgi:hypothetical protein